MSCGADSKLSLVDVAPDLSMRCDDKDMMCVKPAAEQEQSGAAATAHAQAGFNQVAVRHDCRIGAAACWDGTVRVFDLHKRALLRPLAVLRFHSGCVNCVAFAPGPPVGAARDGMCEADRSVGGARRAPAGGGATTGADPWLMASGSKDKRIAVWKLYPGREC